MLKNEFYLINSRISNINIPIPYHRAKPNLVKWYLLTKVSHQSACVLTLAYSSPYLFCNLFVS